VHANLHAVLLAERKFFGEYCYMALAFRKLQPKQKRLTAKSAVGKLRRRSESSAQVDAPMQISVSSLQFDVGSFCKRYAIKRDLISRMTSYAPRTVADWAAGKPLKGAAILKVTELKRLASALEQLVDANSIGPWLSTPNESFEGSTPAQLVERGEVDRLWRMIHLLASGQPG
jgi:hypothetical protein